MSGSPIRRRERLGWWLFVACAVLFLGAGVRDADVLVIVASTVFLVACVVFLMPGPPDG